jgi:hypothetical protein
MKKILAVALLGLHIACNNSNKTNNNGKQPVFHNDTAQRTVRPATHYTAPDLSPMDMIYYPPDYPLQKMSGTVSVPPLARIIYSRPQKQGRKIFGELVKYNEPWRLGANEATELEFFTPATIQHKVIKPGRYILYCIPNDSTWTLVLNANLYSWGLHQHPEKDLHRFVVPVEKNTSTTEYFTMAFEGNGKQASLLMLWDDVKVTLPITF